MCPRLPLSIGGCASNVAMDLARLGVSVGVVGCVGQDYFGRFIIDTLAAAGIDVARHSRTARGRDIGHIDHQRARRGPAFHSLGRRQRRAAR